MPYYIDTLVAGFLYATLIRHIIRQFRRFQATNGYAKACYADITPLHMLLPLPER